VPGLAPTRVVVADDSALMRRVLADALVRAGYDVVGEARDGDEALALCRSSRPDVLTLDLAMPGLDGLGVLRALRDAASPVPVVVVSAFSPAHGARAVDALSEGAIDLVRKPAFGEDPGAFLGELADKVRNAAGSRMRRRAAAPVAPTAAARRTAHVPRVVVIASSTGGPRALNELLPKLPSPLGRGTLIVQHMPAGFTSSLAQRLDRASQLTVVEAAGGERLDPGVALLAPGGSHLRLTAGAARLSDDEAIGGLRPRADLTIADVASMYGKDTLLVVLTGMGKDGLDGARAVKARGGVVLAEAESTCTVYGMPRAVAEAGLADAVLPLDELPAAIAAEAGR
jgi:two-component system chemotaxis response regulator CheB